MLYEDCLLGELIKSGDESSVWNTKFGHMYLATVLHLEL